MKKTFLTLALAIFVMAGFAGNDAPEIIIKKKIENAVSIIKNSSTINQNQIKNDALNFELEEVCYPFDMCGFIGWACGKDMDEAVRNAVIGYIYNCTFD